LGAKNIAVAALVCLFANLLTGPSSAYSPPTCTISGTDKSERITGTNGDDVICAGAGNDVVNALGGNDIVFGGLGNDRIIGGTGNDDLRGESGEDYLEGGLGKDNISGGSGKDTAIGGSSSDFIQGGAGSDNINGGAGNDVIDGGLAKDVIRSGEGADNCGMDPADQMLDSCSIDTSAPVFGMNTADVKSFEAGSTIKLSWMLSDESGVAQSWASIGGAPGWITSWCGFGIEVPLASGDTKNGSYQFECAVPEKAVSGIYTLYMGASDVFGNSNASNASITFEIVGGSSDSSAPKPSSIYLDSTSTPGGEFSLTVDATDETGVSGVWAYFMKDDGGGFASYPNYGLYVSQTQIAELVSGNSKSGTYSLKFQVSSLAPAGTYTLWLGMMDELGNRTFFTTEHKLRVSD